MIAELMDMDAVLHRGMLSKSDASQLRSFTTGSGMTTLYENGLGTVFSGATTYDEVLRVAHDLRDGST